MEWVAKSDVFNSCGAFTKKHLETKDEYNWNSNHWYFSTVYRKPFSFRNYEFEVYSWNIVTFTWNAISNIAFTSYKFNKFQRKFRSRVKCFKRSKCILQNIKIYRFIYSNDFAACVRIFLTKWWVHKLLNPLQIHPNTSRYTQPAAIT